ncbi:MAG: hypothetical protein AAF220_05125, partial [Pseudomonadota bacterium]
KTLEIIAAMLPSSLHLKYTLTPSALVLTLISLTIACAPMEPLWSDAPADSQQAPQEALRKEPSEQQPPQPQPVLAPQPQQQTWAELMAAGERHLLAGAFETAASRFADAISNSEPGSIHQAEALNAQARAFLAGGNLTDARAPNVRALKLYNGQIPATDKRFRDALSVRLAVLEKTGGDGEKALKLRLYLDQLNENAAKRE